MTTVQEPLTDPGRSHADGWLARAGRRSAIRRRPVILAWLVVVALAAPLALGVAAALSGAGWDPQGTTAAAVRDELRRDFPAVGAESAVVVYRQEQPIAPDPDVLARLVADLRGAPGAAPLARARRARRRRRRRSARGRRPPRGMRLGMPGARVVDEGRTSRDGYELLVESFGAGAASPLFVTTPATDAQAVVDAAVANPGVADARVVAEPSPAGRTASAPRSSASSTRASSTPGRPCTTSNDETERPVCRRTQCRTCNRPTYAGCGRHIEQVLGDVPVHDRCRCAEARGPRVRDASPPWWSRLRRRRRRT